MARRVLVVDDDPDMRSALVRALKYDGREVYPTADAGEASAMLSAWRPDVLLLDVNGVGDVEGLARSAARAEVPVILTSGRGSPHLTDAAARLGAAAALRKPFDLDTLVVAVAAAHRESRKTGSRPPTAARAPRSGVECGG